MTQETVVQVQMFGDFTIECCGKSIRTDDSRSRRIWHLIAYLMFHRDRVVSKEELLRILWLSDPNENLRGAFKTVLYRTRKALEEIQNIVGAELIVRDIGGYRWNPSIPVESDCAVLEKAARSVGDENPPDITALLNALDCYRGEFLSRFAGELWVVSANAYYTNLYRETVFRTLQILETNGQVGDSVALCKKALVYLWDQESLYQYYIRNLLRCREYGKAKQVYEEMRSLLFTRLGITPDENSQALYQEIIQGWQLQALPSAFILEQLRENDPQAGAILCEYPIFRQLYQAEARSLSRRKEESHIAIMSISGKKGHDISQRSLHTAMKNLSVVLQRGLRKGDSVSRCSASQFVIMLLQANRENSDMVCRRLADEFRKAYPHSPVVITFDVLPMTPLKNTRTIPQTD